MLTAIAERRENNFTACMHVCQSVHESMCVLGWVGVCVCGSAGLHFVFSEEILARISCAHASRAPCFAYCIEIRAPQQYTALDVDMINNS
jgi:hypothetical protein